MLIIFEARNNVSQDFTSDINHLSLPKVNFRIESILLMIEPKTYFIPQGEKRKQPKQLK